MGSLNEKLPPPPPPTCPAVGLEGRLQSELGLTGHTQQNLCSFAFSLPSFPFPTPHPEKGRDHGIL